MNKKSHLKVSNIISISLSFVLLTLTPKASSNDTPESARVIAIRNSQLNEIFFHQIPNVNLKALSDDPIQRLTYLAMLDLSYPKISATLFHHGHDLSLLFASTDESMKIIHNLKIKEGDILKWLRQGLDFEIPLSYSEQLAFLMRYFLFTQKVAINMNLHESVYQMLDQKLGYSYLLKKRVMHEFLELLQNPQSYSYNRSLQLKNALAANGISVEFFDLLTPIILNSSGTNGFQEGKNFAFYLEVVQKYAENHILAKWFPFPHYLIRDLKTKIKLNMNHAAVYNFHKKLISQITDQTELPISNHSNEDQSLSKSSPFKINDARLSLLFNYFPHDMLEDFIQQYPRAYISLIANKFYIPPIGSEREIKTNTLIFQQLNRAPALDKNDIIMLLTAMKNLHQTSLELEELIVTSMSSSSAPLFKLISPHLNILHLRKFRHLSEYLEDFIQMYFLINKYGDLNVNRVMREIIKGQFSHLSMTQKLMLLNALKKQSDHLSLQELTTHRASLQSEINELKTAPNVCITLLSRLL